MIPLRNLSCLQFATITFALIFCSTQVPGQMLDWSAGRKLTWSDFTQIPDDGKKIAALTTYEISYEFVRGASGWEPIVSCRFNQRESWVKRTRERKYILEHEQLHFDIAELFARKLRKKYDELSWIGGRPERSPQAVFEEIFASCKVMQWQYDEETDHGTIDVQQDRWASVVAELLGAFQEYSSATSSR